MKYLISVFAFLVCIAASPALMAAPNLPTVTPEKIQKLKELHNKAEEQIAMNNYKGATDTLQDILLMEPDDETAYVNLGQIYLLFSQNDKAKNAFQNALSIDPENEVAINGLQMTTRHDGYSYPETGPDPPSRSELERSEDPSS